jgi:hypothetical protein
MRCRPRRSRAAVRATASRSADVAARLGPAAILLLAVALEALPVTAWLDTSATFTAGTPGLAALPFWFVYGAILASALLAGLARRFAPAAPLVRSLVALGWLAALVVALRVSPAAYAGVPAGGVLGLGWLGTLGRDVATGADRLAPDIGLLALNAYLWWRGLRLGVEGATYDRLWLAFRLGLGATVLALVAMAATSGAPRAALGDRLALLLPVQVGAGLAALALAHVDDFVRTRLRPASGEASGRPADFGEAPWLLTAFGLAAVVVGGALSLALVLSYDALQSLAGALRPIGNALGAAVEWAIEGVSYVLFIVFNGLVQWIFRHANHKPGQVTVPSSPLSKTHPTPAHPALGVPSGWLVAGRIVLLALAMLFVAFILLRVLRRFARRPRPDEVAETREALDARGLLGAQLRALFGGRHRVRPAADENLPRASVRQLYRDVLRAALRAGRGRSAAETPEEYRRRFVGAPTGPGGANGDGEAAADLAGLTRLYERARYGDLPDEARDREAAREESRRLLQWLARHRERRRGADTG